MTNIQETLQSLAALPDDRPMGMPGAFYTCPKQFEWECKNVLKHGWHCLGRVDEIPNQGDFLTAHILTEPILVVRGDDDKIRAFANVCRHRGMPLVSGSGNAQRFVCSYHAWTYGKDGSLLRAARMENAGFDIANCRLHEHNLHMWNGFIYVNLDQDAEPFNHPDLDQILAPYDPEAFHLVHVAEEEWHCNWKNLVENFMEGYHLSVVHPQTLHGYTPTGLSKKLAGGGGFTSYAANYPDAIPSRGNGAPGLTKEEQQRSSLFSIFPCQVASQSATLLVSLSIVPLEVGKIRVKWTMSTYKDELDGETLKERVSLWEEVNKEDREKLERMYVALHSEHALAGPLAGADYEGTVRDFLIWMAEEDKRYA